MVLLCLYTGGHTQITSMQALLLARGPPPDIAQIPEELQPNLITAAVAMGLQHAPVIEPGSDRLAHRWAWSIHVWPLALQCIVEELPQSLLSKAGHLPFSQSRKACSSALRCQGQSINAAACHLSATPHQCVRLSIPLTYLNITQCHAEMWVWLS